MLLRVQQFTGSKGLTSEEKKIKYSQWIKIIYLQKVNNGRSQMMINSSMKYIGSSRLTPKTIIENRNRSITKELHGHSTVNTYLMKFSKAMKKSNLQ